MRGVTTNIFLSLVLPVSRANHAQLTLRPQPRAAATDNEMLEAAARVLSWVLENGGGASVKPGVDSNGIRGLVAERSCDTGEVLLEVPMSLAITIDINNSLALPEWTLDMRWKTQLAWALLERSARGTADPYLDSWPDKPPPLAIMSKEDLANCKSDDLGGVHEVCSWVEEQYEILCEAAAAAENNTADGEKRIPSASAFREAMAFVRSRSIDLRDMTDGIGLTLVPALDLANHDASPSAMIGYADGSHGGPSFRLYALRPHLPGDTVTIPYGKHTNAEFAYFYGFVPHSNPFDRLWVSIFDVLPRNLEQLGPEPQGGWPAKIKEVCNVNGTGRSAHGGLESNSSSAGCKFELRAGAPSTALLQALCKLLPGGYEAAADRVAQTAADFEIDWFGYSADSFDELDAEAEKAVKEDEREICSADSLQALLIKLRLERRRMLIALRRAMLQAEKRCHEDPQAGGRELEALATKHDTLAATHVPPSVSALDLYRWGKCHWDWHKRAWSAADGDSEAVEAGVDEANQYLQKQRMDLFLQNLPDTISVLVSAIVLMVLVGANWVTLTMPRSPHGPWTASEKPLMAG